MGGLFVAGSACANRGMQPPGEEIGTAGTSGTAGTFGPGDAGTSGTAGSSAAGTTGTAGAAGTTGTAGRGGTAGTGTGGAGTDGSAGVVGGGGVGGSAGTTGSGGAGGSGGTTGSAGASGTTGTAGAGGTTGTAGASGTTGTAGAGGVAGSTAGAGGATGGRGGAGGTAGASGGGGATAGQGGGGNAGGGGGASGASGNVCPLGGVLDCSSAGALTLATDGQVATFSPLEWNTSTKKWCNVRGLDGGVFAYAGAGSMSTAAVDATAQNLKLTYMVAAGGYAGGALTFDSCVNAAAFTSVVFTAALASGTLSGCVWQVQVQTQDQKASTDTNPSGGTCASNCYRYPAATGLAVPTASGTTYTEPFSSFNNPGSSAIPTRTQIVGIQWQVNSNAGTGTCSGALTFDNVKFQ
jgi:hypothetical protein